MADQENIQFKRSVVVLSGQIVGKCKAPLADVNDRPEPREFGPQDSERAFLHAKSRMHSLIRVAIPAIHIFVPFHQGSDSLDSFPDGQEYNGNESQSASSL